MAVFLNIGAHQVGIFPFELKICKKNWTFVQNVTNILVSKFVLWSKNWTGKKFFNFLISKKFFPFFAFHFKELDRHEELSREVHNQVIKQQNQRQRRRDTLEAQLTQARRLCIKAEDAAVKAIEKAL